MHRNRSFKPLLLLLILLLLLQPFSFTAAAAEEMGVKGPGNLSAEHILLVDLNSDTILYEKEADTPAAPASLTKIMTILLALESDIPLQDTVTLPSGLWQEFIGINISNADLASGERMPFFDLLACAALPSANEAASAISLLVTNGDRDAFISKMNQRAKELGAQNTNFVNPHGLDEDGHMTTARDLFLITREAIKNEAFLDLVSLSSHTLPETNFHASRTIYSTNKLMNPDSEYYTEGVKGIKTGTTYAAGRCIIALCETDDMLLLAVVMGSDFTDTYGNTLPGNAALADTKTLFEWAKANFASDSFLPTLQTPITLPVLDGKGKEEVAVTVTDEISPLLPKNVIFSDLTQSVTLSAQSLTAPVNKGQTVGELQLSYQGRVVASVPLRAAESVELDEFGVKMRAFFASDLLHGLLLGMACLLILFVLLLMIRAKNRQKNRKRRRR